MAKCFALRVNTYSKLNDFTKVGEDFDRAIEILTSEMKPTEYGVGSWVFMTIFPSNPLVQALAKYDYERGVNHQTLGNIQEATNDFSRTLHYLPAHPQASAAFNTLVPNVSS